MIEVAAALSAATTAFNAIKKGFEVGRDIESITLAKAVQYHSEQRVFLNNNKTVIFK